MRSRIQTFDWYQNWYPRMTLNRVMAIILRYFTEFGSFRGALRKSVLRVRCRRKKFTFDISSPDEFLVFILRPIAASLSTC